MEKFYFGILFTQTLFLDIFAHNCSIVNTAGQWKMDCRRMNLKKVPPSPSANIQILDLAENNLTKINNCSFDGYGGLLVLNLNDNQIESIEPDGFGGLENLQKLTLAGNNLNVTSNSSKWIFRKIRDIQYLDFSRNMDARDLYKKLNLIYPDKEFQHLTKLQNLSVDLYGFPEFGVGFKNLPLKVLSFSGCYIKHLQNKTFKNFPPTVVEIRLTTCALINVHNIENNLFGPFINLSRLDMSWTEITLTKGLELLYPMRRKSMELINFGHMWNSWTNRTIVPFAIILTPSNMQYLNSICVKTLIIADNNVVDILPNSLFASPYLNCYEEIDLSGNRFGFSAMPLNELFTITGKLVNLKILDFSYIPLKYLDAKFLPYSAETNIRPNISHFPNYKVKEYCSKIPARHSLDVHLRLPPIIEYIRVTHVMGAPYLKSLTLKNITSLKYVDMSYYDVMCFPDINLKEEENNIEYLDLSGIDCKAYIRKSKFPIFPKLKTLMIRAVNFHQAVEEDKNVFLFTPNLEYLDLSANALFRLPYNFLESLKNLSYLCLSLNHFRYLPSGLNQLTKLISLDIKDNRLFTIFRNHSSFFDGQQLKYGSFYLKLKYNDFSCSCEFRDFISWINTTKVNLSNKGSYRCRLANGSTSTTDVVYRHYHDIYASCEAVTWLKFGIAIIVSFFSILLPIAIIYNFRWRIFFYCFRKFRNIMEGTMNLNYEYDVYVSYGYDGYSWVQEVLIKQLEGHWGLTVCLEDRDFDLGKSTYEEIANAIDKSRHLILVVSNNFMSNPFAAYEIDRAREAKTARTLQNIIIITINLNMEDIPTDLQSIWGDVSVIEWPCHSDESESAKHNLRTRLILNF